VSGPVAIEASTSGQPSPGRLAASRAHCERLTRRRARNFYHGMKLVPEPKRSAMYALYGWMGQADDLADAAGTPEQKTAALEAFRRQTYRVIDPDTDPAQWPEDPIWPAVADLVRTYRIPRKYLDQMIDGQLLDQRRSRYGSFEQLYDYCYKVASVVGLSCIEIWGYEGGAATRQLSEWRGIAFQLTNILRDVREDAGRGRVYLPAEDFDVYELNPAMFTVGRPQAALAGFRAVIERARHHYEKSAPLDSYVHPDGRQPEAVLRGRRVRLGRLHKGWIALSAPWRRGAPP